MTQAHDELARSSREAALRIVSVLRDNPVRASGPFPIATVRGQLGELQRALVAAIDRYPLALTVDTDGRPDRLGVELAKLVSKLSHLVVYYHGLDDIPEARRGPAHFEWEELRRIANGVVSVASDE